MKKILVTILAFVYLSTSIGATVHLHYCMGKLLSWGLINHESKHSDFCGMAKKTDNDHCISSKKGCCRDETKQIKTGGDQKIFSSEFEFLKVFTQGNAISHSIPLAFHTASIAIGYPVTHALPLTGKPAVFLLNRNFRI